MRRHLAEVRVIESGQPSLRDGVRFGAVYPWAEAHGYRHAALRDAGTAIVEARG